MIKKTAEHKLTKSDIELLNDTNKILGEWNNKLCFIV